MRELQDWLSGAAYIQFLVVWSAVWAVVFLCLWIASKQHAWRLGRFLRTAVGRTDVAARPDWNPERHPYDEILAFLKTVSDIADDPSQERDREVLARVIEIKDADRLDFRRARFEWGWSLARAQIEILPLLGIIGTLWRMTLALGGDSSPTDAALEGLTRKFAESLASTTAALGGAVVLMALNAWVEPGFTRLVELRAEFRRVVNHARRVLAETPARPTGRRS
jgi:biopolymer transport protein ExbB/TolQ